MIRGVQSHTGDTSVLALHRQNARLDRGSRIPNIAVSVAESSHLSIGEGGKDKNLRPFVGWMNGDEAVALDVDVIPLERESDVAPRWGMSTGS